jgi:amino acid transporter
MGVITLILSLGLGSWWGPSLAFGFLATAFTYGWILMFIMANVALPFYYRKEHAGEFSMLKHVVFPAIGTIALIPALVAPVLPYFPAFSAAGPVAWQLVATVPLTVAWAIVGAILARTMNQKKAAQVAMLGMEPGIASQEAA